MTTPLVDLAAVVAAQQDQINDLADTVDAHERTITGLEERYDDKLAEMKKQIDQLLRERRH